MLAELKFQKVLEVHSVASSGLRPGLWRQEIDRRVEEAATVRALTADGLRRLAGASGDDLARLRDMHDMYAFLEGGYTHLRDTWRERESRGRTDSTSTDEGEQAWPRPGRRE